MTTIILKTKKNKQVVPITELINKELEKAAIAQGLCFLHVLHTSCALTTADLDPGTDLDMLDAFEAMVPQLNYRHPHDPSHVGDHIMTSIIGTSLVVPIKDGGLLLGTWQEVVLIEFNGPKERSLVLCAQKA